MMNNYSLYFYRKVWGIRLPYLIFVLRCDATSGQPGMVKVAYCAN